MDVVFQMRHARKVILIDAAQTGKPAGTVFQVPGSVVEDLPDMPSVSSHDLRWDHALGMGHWLLGPYFPTQVEVFLIEAGGFEWGAPLTQPVSEAADRVVQLILQKVGLADASQPGTPTGIPTEQKQQGEASSEPEHHD
jgi:hydrogenase maturation protease